MPQVKGVSENDPVESVRKKAAAILEKLSK